MSADGCVRHVLFGCAVVVGNLFYGVLILMFSEVPFFYCNNVAGHPPANAAAKVQLEWRRASILFVSARTSSALASKVFCWTRPMPRKH
eukprot:3504365-Amphidinium_carterae.1